MPWQASMAFASSTLAAPLARTEYVLPVPGLLWFHDVIVDEQDFFGFTQDTVHPYQAGQDISDDWTGQPSPPGLEQETAAGEACPVCRSGDTLSLQLMPFTDAAGHYQLPDPSVTSQLSLYQNGTLTGQAPSTFAQFPMSPSPASYRLVLAGPARPRAGAAARRRPRRPRRAAASSRCCSWATRRARVPTTSCRPEARPRSP
jgi:hypothetical protein